jgi:hypothetical protein
MVMKTVELIASVGMISCLMLSIAIVVFFPKQTDWAILPLLLIAAFYLLPFAVALDRRAPKSKMS